MPPFFFSHPTLPPNHLLCSMLSFSFLCGVCGLALAKGRKVILKWLPLCSLFFKHGTHNESCNQTILHTSIEVLRCGKGRGGEIEEHACVHKCMKDLVWGTALLCINMCIMYVYVHVYVDACLSVCIICLWLCVCLLSCEWVCVFISLLVCQSLAQQRQQCNCLSRTTE